MATKSQIFSVTNKLRSLMPQKDAYAMAKQILEGDNSDLFKKLIAIMSVRDVKFIYINERGQKIKTSGTLVETRIPTNRIVQGRKQPKNDDMIVYYDTRHGQYRPLKKNNVVSIL